MRVCGEMALDQIALFQTAKGLKSQSHSCFHGRMAVTAVILPFFVPAAFNRRNTNMEEPKGTAKRRAKTAAAAQEDKITLLPLSELHDFPNHPFKVRDDEAIKADFPYQRKSGSASFKIALPLKLYRSQLSRLFFLFCFCRACCCCFRRKNSRTGRASASSFSRLKTSRLLSYIISGSYLSP